MSDEYRQDSPYTPRHKALEEIAKLRQQLVNLRQPPDPIEPAEDETAKSGGAI
ncbi:MAG TPA: hypothetical protein VNV87_01425 [Acidimicrobiales bacterium]|jgi:hypothetical protein|nr:hypothetical protein [Acidimicrobiales bacterium]